MSIKARRRVSMSIPLKYTCTSRIVCIRLMESKRVPIGLVKESCIAMLPVDDRCCHNPSRNWTPTRRFVKLFNLEILPHLVTTNTSWQQKKWSRVIPQTSADLAYCDHNGHGLWKEVWINGVSSIVIYPYVVQRLMKERQRHGRANVWYQLDWSGNENWESAAFNSNIL